MADDYVWNVQRGDYVAKIAAAKGVSEWNTLWDYNIDLKSKRRFPTLLSEGDVVLVPVADDGEESGTTKDNHPFEAPTAKLYLQLRLLKDDFSPLANLSYSLQLNNEPTPRSGTTDSRGQVREEISVESTAAVVTVTVPSEGKTDTGELTSGATVSWTLWIGALHPLLEDAPDENCLPGVQQRLNNLGFSCGVVNGQLNDATKAAIRNFCKKNGLEERDSPDTTFQHQLWKVHDEKDYEKKT